MHRLAGWRLVRMQQHLIKRQQNWDIHCFWLSMLHAVDCLRCSWFWLQLHVMWLYIVIKSVKSSVLLLACFKCRNNVTTLYCLVQDQVSIQKLDCDSEKGSHYTLISNIVICWPVYKIILLAHSVVNYSKVYYMSYVFFLKKMQYFMIMLTKTTEMEKLNDIRRMK